MSKSALKRLRKSLGLPVCREPLPAFAWPGGYPVVYLFSDGGAICPECLNKNVDLVDEANRGGSVRNSHGGWAVGGWEVNWEDVELRCDHCGSDIPSAYAD